MRRSFSLAKVCSLVKHYIWVERLVSILRQDNLSAKVSRNKLDRYVESFTKILDMDFSLGFEEYGRNSQSRRSIIQKWLGNDRKCPIINLFFSLVVKTNVFLKDMNDFGAMNSVYAEGRSRHFILHRCWSKNLTSSFHRTSTCSIDRSSRCSSQSKSILTTTINWSLPLFRMLLWKSKVLHFLVTLSKTDWDQLLIIRTDVFFY